ncbi:hypothetical protein BCR37DRAFT_292247 [Protomyces lactucae-debilis]|uniref:Uncharacterized protein n=1 Tax=Protomyces lactucae-debilis TaxID=2754530 RepID=A0A1Y2FIK5_PROLT|nr:uncharacterized protein BCR37DRAFT_292247 [Protomyces lactucae-debilis]ORY83076.1 hypothetical protein BCR37DRAFT_292247 [Protomyces lactucae-debilis]
MDAYEVFAAGTAIWSALQATVLILSPTLVATMLVPDIALHRVTDLERYLCKALGLSITGLSLLYLLLSGLMPFGASMSASQASGSVAAHVPSLWVGVLYNASMSFLQYLWGTSEFRSTAIFSSCVNAFLAAMGGWILLFALDKDGKIKHRAFTADGGKASSFPFKNKVREDAKKKAF